MSLSRLDMDNAARKLGCGFLGSIPWRQAVISTPSSARMHLPWTEAIMNGRNLSECWMRLPHFDLPVTDASWDPPSNLIASITPRNEGKKRDRAYTKHGYTRKERKPPAANVNRDLMNIISVSHLSLLPSSSSSSLHFSHPSSHHNTLSSPHNRYCSCIVIIIVTVLVTACLCLSSISSIAAMRVRALLVGALVGLGAASPWKLHHHPHPHHPCKHIEAAKVPSDIGPGFDVGLLGPIPLLLGIRGKFVCWMLLTYASTSELTCISQSRP